MLAFNNDAVAFTLLPLGEVRCWILTPDCGYTELANLDVSCDQSNISLFPSPLRRFPLWRLAAAAHTPRSDCERKRRYVTYPQGRVDSIALCTRVFSQQRQRTLDGSRRRPCPGRPGDPNQGDVSRSAADSRQCRPDHGRRPCRHRRERPGRTTTFSSSQYETRLTTITAASGHHCLRRSKHGLVTRDTHRGRLPGTSQTGRASWHH